MSLIMPAVLSPEDMNVDAELTMSTSSPNARKSFLKGVADMFDELLRQCSIALSIKVCGKEDEWKMLAFIRAKLKEILESESEVCPLPYILSVLYLNIFREHCLVHAESARSYSIHLM